MTTNEKLEEIYIEHLAKGLSLIGVTVDLTNDSHYVGCRYILEAAAEYLNQTQINKSFAAYAGVSRTVAIERS